MEDKAVSRCQGLLIYFFSARILLRKKSYGKIHGLPIPVARQPRNSGKSSGSSLPVPTASQVHTPSISV